jgi:thiol-disulfide isomerase/thioredoxin
VPSLTRGLTRGPRRPDPLCRRASRVARSRLARAAAGAALAVLTAATVAGCGGGAIGANDPASSGKSFVSGSYATTVFPASGRPASPNVSGTTLTGQKLALSSFRGNVLVMNFWGSWCSPCRREAPQLAALARHYQPAGVRFLGVDIRDSLPSARAFDQTFRIGYPSLTDPAGTVALAFQSTVPPAGIPTTLVIDRTGHVAARIVGQVSYNSLGRLIARIAGRPT